MNSKKCIFHIPYSIDKKIFSGSYLRPAKMLEAFESIGYEVHSVMGYGEERKKQIQRIKENIAKGIKYDFLYSESSTMPTLLTEKNHMPKYPFLDFSFMNFCKKQGVPIGLFYRDMHWRFEHYKSTLSLHKKMITIPLYKYDLKKYKKLLDIMYVPSKRFAELIPEKINCPMKELPSGIMKIDNIKPKTPTDQLNIFYVGGIIGNYDMKLLFETVYDLDFVNLTICCRKDEWEQAKSVYASYINDRITIVHKSGLELKPYFEKADIVSLILRPGEYMKLSMPVKIFEYLSYSKPILAVKGSASGDFVEENDIGWSLDYTKESFQSVLKDIQNNRGQIDEKIENIKSILSKNTWEYRATTVAQDLLAIKNKYFEVGE